VRVTLHASAAPVAREGARQRARNERWHAQAQNAYATTRLTAFVRSCAAAASPSIVHARLVKEQRLCATGPAAAKHAAEGSGPPASCARARSRSSARNGSFQFSRRRAPQLLRAFSISARLASKVACAAVGYVCGAAARKEARALMSHRDPNRMCFRSIVDRRALQQQRRNNPDAHVRACRTFSNASVAAPAEGTRHS
jgi:hypothetical protein